MLCMMRMFLGFDAILLRGNKICANTPMRPTVSWKGKRVEIVKVLVIGDLEAGRMEFIRQLSDIEAIFAEIKGVDIGLDFGLLKIDSSTQVYLYGTPNVKHFNLEGYAGFFNENVRRGIVLIADAAANSLHKISACLSQIRQRDVPYVIAMSHLDQRGAMTEQAVKQALGVKAGEPVVPCQMDSLDDVRAVIVALVDRMTEDSTVRKIRAKLAVHVDSPPTHERKIEPTSYIEHEDASQGF
jgi:signal recognition particle receptor subunit beta